MQAQSTTQHREPLREQRLARIKAGKDPDGPFSEAELAVQRDWEMCIHNYVNNHICMECQDKIKVDDDSDLEYNSSFLLDLDL